MNPSFLFKADFVLKIWEPNTKEIELIKGFNMLYKELFLLILILNKISASFKCVPSTN